MATWGFRKEDVGMAEEELGGDSVELCNKDVEIRDRELQDKGVKDGGWRRRRRQDGDMSQGSVLHTCCTRSVRSVCASARCSMHLSVQWILKKILD